MIGLSELDHQFNKDTPPSDIEMMWWAFWEKGISFTEFQRTPIPVILSILKAELWVLQQRKEKING